MTVYFAVTNDRYEIAKLIVDQHTDQGIGLNLVVKVHLFCMDLHAFMFPECVLHRLCVCTTLYFT